MSKHATTQEEPTGGTWETIARRLMRDRILHRRQQLHQSLKQLDSHIAEQGDLTDDALTDVRYHYIGIMNLIEEDIAPLLEEPHQFEGVLHAIPDHRIADFLETQGYEVRERE